jgi:DNA invertase Pin-like site-specific DNA recombinase
LSVALYARVSTTDQDPTMQIRELKESADRRFWKVFDCYVDEISSDSKFPRPALERLMRDARAGKFHAVLVWKFDRFARSMLELVNFAEIFHGLGIDFLSLRDGVDTTTPQGKLFFHITAAFAEYERDVIRMRVKAGLDNARAQGKKLGRPRVPVDAYLVAELRQNGHGQGRGLSWKEISQKLGVGSGTARRALLSLAKSPLAKVSVKR